MSQIGSSPLSPPLRGVHSPGVRKHCQIIFGCYFRKKIKKKWSRKSYDVFLEDGKHFAKITFFYIIVTKGCWAWRKRTKDCMIWRKRRTVGSGGNEGL